MYTLYIMYVYRVKIHTPYRTNLFFIPEETTGKIEKAFIYSTNGEQIFYRYDTNVKAPSRLF